MGQIVWSDLSERGNSHSQSTGKKKIPAIEIVGAIQHIQNIIFHLGDYFYGNPNRPKGDFPQTIKDSCTLFVTNIEMRSVHAQMQIGDTQSGITDLGTKEKVPIDIEFEDDYDIASNDDLGLLAVQPKMELLIEELKGQLSVLWQEYVLDDENELALSGKDLRKMRISIVGAQSV